MALLQVIEGGRVGPPPSIEARRSAYREQLVGEIRRRARELPEGRRLKMLARLPAWSDAAVHGDFSRLLEVVIELRREQEREAHRLMQPGDGAA